MRALIIFLTVSIIHVAVTTYADEPAVRNPNTDSRDRSAAVALNYCRAAFHRIKRAGTKPVLLEEQENILNNLNLNGIADQEVVTLYTKVLEDIGGETIAEQERLHLKSQFRKNLARQTMASAFLMSAQVTSFQFGQAVRTGAASWWDYRNLDLQKEVSIWNIEKDRMIKLVNSSSHFLDTFWKMIQKKNIPDRWLIRSADLESLDEALAENDPRIRLRLLQRIEKFMECYPPYWYHVARTHQALGHWDDATATYENLANYGAGHFRRDEMLATGMANLAAIQDFQGKREAARTAKEALSYADTAWQANLVCARILSKYGEYKSAEEAALRNIDARLERTQSLVALLSIYEESGEHQKLVRWLRDEEILPQIPVPAVLRACAYLGSDEVPTNVNRHLLRTLYGYADLNLGMDDVVVRADPLWQVETAQVQLALNGRTVPPPVVEQEDGRTQLRFRNVGQLGGIFASAPPMMKIDLVLRYPHMRPTVLNLQRIAAHDASMIWEQDGMRQPSRVGRRGGTFMVSNINFQGRELALIQFGQTQAPSVRGRLVETPANTNSAPPTIAGEKTFVPAANPFRPASRSDVTETVEEKPPTIHIDEITPVEEDPEAGEPASQNETAVESTGEN